MPSLPEEQQFELKTERLDSVLNNNRRNSNNFMPESQLSSTNLAPFDFDSDDSVDDSNYVPSNESGDTDNENPSADADADHKALVKSNLQASTSARAIALELLQMLKSTTKVQIKDGINTVDFRKLVSVKIENVAPCNTVKSIKKSVTKNSDCSLSKTRKVYKTSLADRINDKKQRKRMEYTVKPGCNKRCLKKCFTQFNEEQREKINEEYWSLTWEQRRHYMRSQMAIAVPKRKSTNEPKRKPKRTFKLMTSDGNVCEVCKVFFLTTLGYKKSNDTVLQLLNNDIDKRGKHQKTPAYDRQLLTKHVESFYPYEPQHGREHAPLRRYLPSNINIRHMHKDYCEKNPNVVVSYDLYRKHLKSMNISFKRLTNEECKSYDLHKPFAIDVFTTKTEEVLSKERQNTVNCELVSVKLENITPCNTAETTQDSETKNLDCIPTKKRKIYKTSLADRINEKKQRKRIEYTVKPGCNENCLKKCFTHFNEKQRVKINEEYWSLTWEQRRHYMRSRIAIAVPKRKSTNEPKRKPKRTFTLITSDGNVREVCKVFFLTTLGYNKNNDTVLQLLNNDVDKRGKHQKTPAYDRQLLTKHVESFYPNEPQHSREHAPLRRYLSSNINVRHMHKDYCEKNPNVIVSYDLYRKHLKSMNISFTRITNEDCESYDLHKPFALDVFTSKTEEVLSKERQNTVNCELGSVKLENITPCNTAETTQDSETKNLDCIPTKKRKIYKTSLADRMNEKKQRKRMEYIVKPGCNEKCLKKCFTHFNEKQRVKINEEYWSLTWEQRRHYMRSRMAIAVPKRKSTNEPKRKPKRTFTLITSDGNVCEVCKFFFLTTLGYKKSNDTVLTLLNNDVDKRGKHQKTPAYDRQLLTKHVESFSLSEPQHSREHAPLRRYLPSSINVRHMHKDYCEKNPNVVVSYDLYRKHLRNMNVLFTRPINEDCESYDLYKPIFIDCTKHTQ